MIITLGDALKELINNLKKGGNKNDRKRSI